MKAIIIGSVGAFLSLCLFLGGEAWAFFTLIFSGMIIAAGLDSENKNKK